MEKFNKFISCKIFLDPEKKMLSEIDENEKRKLDDEKLVFVGPNFITMKEALAIAGGRDPSKVVDKDGLCSSFLMDPAKSPCSDPNKNVCQNCIHSELKPRTLFFKSRFYCKIGKGANYMSPRDFN